MTSSPDDAQGHFSGILRMLSAQLPTGVTGTTLVIWTLVAVLAVRVSVYIVSFILWQIKLRTVMKQFHVGSKVGTSEHEDNTFHYSVRWYTPFHPALVCFHPGTIKPCLSNITRRAGWAYKFFRPWLGDGLLLSEGRKWQRNRRLLTPAFHFEILKHYVQLFSESSGVLLNKWLSNGPGASVELYDHINRMTLDNILKCSLGYNSSCQTDGVSTQYIQAVHDLTRLIDKRYDNLLYYVDFIYFLSASGRRFREACSVVHTFSEQLIRKRKEALEAKSLTSSTSRRGKCLDLLDILLEAKDEDGNGLTLTEIRDEVNTFLFGGHHTAASGISWTLFHLAKHKEYQDRCREEVEEVLQDRKEMTWRDIGRFPFIAMCIKESMRCITPVPMAMRSLKQGLTFPDGKSLPKGCSAEITFEELHANGEIWPHPKIYDPYRFSPENSKNRHPYAFLPFSAGPRNCIGQNFAMNEMKVAVALILQRFRLELDDTKPPAVPVYSITMQAVNGIWVKIYPVDPSH